MADLPVKKNSAFTFFIPGFVSQANTKIFQVNPTIAAGDITISKDGGAFANPDTLPDVEPNGGTQVRVQLTATEMNADQITIKWSDASGAEWCDGAAVILTSTYQSADMLRPATAGRTLDVDASGKVILQATQTGVTIPTVTTLTNDPSGVTTLLSRIPSTLFAGITSLGQWLGLIAGKQTGNSTARTELRATGAGSGTYDETTDSLEALHDNGISVDANVTLSYNEVLAIADTATGIGVSIMRSVDYAKTFSGLTISASWTKMYFTLKRDKLETDASAQLQIVVSNPAASLTDGVLYVSGAAASAGQRTQGSITVNQGAGTIAIAINDELTAVLNDTTKGNWWYDIKQVTSSGTTQLTGGRAAISDAVTKSIS